MAYRRPAYFAGRKAPATAGITNAWNAARFQPDPSAPAATSTQTRTVPFDYKAWLAHEPTLQGALTQIDLARRNAGTQLVGGEQQLFGRLGEAPDLSQPQFANLPPELRTALTNAITPELQGIIGRSNEAGVSALARLQYDYNKGQSQSISDLMARGAGRSGAVGQQGNENLRGYTLGQYDARQQALDSLQGLQQNYLTGQQTLAGQAGDAVAAAQQRAGQLISAGQLGPYKQTTTVTNPYLNPAAPSQVSTGVKVGSSTTYEPHANPASYGQPPAAPLTPAAPATPKAAPYKAPSLGLRALR